MIGEPDLHFVGVDLFTIRYIWYQAGMNNVLLCKACPYVGEFFCFEKHVFIIYHQLSTRGPSTGRPDLYRFPTFWLFYVLVFLPVWSTHIRVFLNEAVEQWGSEAVRQWSSGAVEQWGSEAVKQWGSEAVEQWGSEAVRQWSSGAVEQWSSEAVKQWSSGTVKQWSSHPFNRRACGMRSCGSYAYRSRWDSSTRSLVDFIFLRSTVVVPRYSIL